jgi:hypothetical protein
VIFIVRLIPQARNDKYILVKTDTSNKLTAGGKTADMASKTIKT